MISLSNITLRRGTENLLQETSLVIYDSRRIALIGRNGCGKSSLFALLMGKIGTEEGDVKIPGDCRIAHMAQEIDHSNRSAIDYVIDGHSVLRKLQAQILKAENNGDNHRLIQLYEQLELADGYSAEHQAAELLHGLGFSNEEMSNPVNSFSGGWRIRLNLAQALMMPSDVMLLDEPTNHLDMDTTFWLEQRLKRYSGSLVLISHDRDFIDNIAQEIVHIENKQLNLYKGNYSAFERQRAERLALQQANYVKQQRQIKHIQSFITRFKAKASKAKQAQSRVKQLDNMEVIASAQVDSPFSFRFFDNDKVSNPLISMRDTRLGYDDNIVLNKVNFGLSPGDRIGLLGVNGAGKSTLIKGLTGDLPTAFGDITRGSNCQIGYFAQHQIEVLDMQESAIWHIQQITPKESEQKIRNFLGGFDFHGDKATQAIAPFSGGEKTRLALAILVWQKPNVLLLDEPTNHLDLDMRSALTLALQDFNGALVVVSHDRHLLRHSVDEYHLIHDGQITIFDGTLEDYHQWVNNSAAKSGQGPSPSVSHSASNSTTNEIGVDSSKSIASKKQKRQQSAQQRKALSAVNNRIKRLEQKMETNKSALQEVEVSLADSAIYEEQNKQQLEDFIYQQMALKRESEALEESWLALNEELEQLT